MNLIAMLKQTCVFCFFVINTSYAQTHTDTLPSEAAIRELDNITVTAQRSKQKNKFIPYSISSLNRRDMEAGSPRTTPEALMAVNGVFLQKTNHGGGSAFIRGLTGNQTLLLVDGIRLNNATFRYGPNQYLNTVDIYSINRIEVAKGTGSVQYGTDAIGGVINMITAEPEFSSLKKPVTKGSVLGKIMSGGMEQTGRVDLSYSGQKAAISAGFTARNFGDLVGGDTTGIQNPSGYSEYAADARAKFFLGKNVSLLLNNQFLQQKEVPVYHKFTLENYAQNHMDPQQRLLSYARLQFTGKTRFISQAAFTLSYQYSKEGRNLRKNGSQMLRREEDKVQTTGITADIKSVLSEQWTATSGVEWYQDKVLSLRTDQNLLTGSTTARRGLYPDGSTYGNYSVFTLHHFKFNRFLVDAGLRYNTFNIHITDATLGKVVMTPSALVGNAALMYVLDKYQTIYTSFSNGFRAPNIDDMGTLGIVDFRYEVPTANLKPERSLHAELGYKIQTKNISGSLAIYNLHITDLITRIKGQQIINGYAVYSKENIETSYIRGFEAELTIQLTTHFLLMNSVAYAYGRNTTKNEPVRRIPPFNGRIAGKWSDKNIFMVAEYRYASAQTRLAQGDKDDNRIPPDGTPGWQVLNVYGGISLKELSLNGGICNILNIDYRSHGSGINNMGRSIYLTATLRF